jgi:hypothetical protein
LRGFFTTILFAATIAGCARHEIAERKWGPQWYHRTRVMALVDSSPRDSVVLSAYGTRLDSLAIFADFFVYGKMAHQEAWFSSYELIEMDSLRADSVALARFLRTRLDSVLMSVAVEPFSMEELRMMGDTDMLRRFPATPQQVIEFSYGYESTLALAWNQRRGRFELLWYCC